MEFSIGQHFNKVYPPEAAMWCNNNGAVIVKEDDGYTIKEVPAPIQSELYQQELFELQSWMAANDYKQFKYLRGEYTEEEWSSIKSEFQSKAARISELRELLEESK